MELRIILALFKPCFGGVLILCWLSSILLLVSAFISHETVAWQMHVLSERVKCCQAPAPLGYCLQEFIPTSWKACSVWSSWMRSNTSCQEVSSHNTINIIHPHLKIKQINQLPLFLRVTGNRTLLFVGSGGGCSSAALDKDFSQLTLVSTGLRGGSISQRMSLQVLVAAVLLPWSSAGKASSAQRPNSQSWAEFAAFSTGNQQLA